MQQTFEFFKGKYELTGKHARMADELCHISEPENNYFKRVVDVYLLAAIVGFRFDRRAYADYSTDDTKAVFGETMLKEKENFDFLLQTMLILENARTMNGKESILKAFKGPQTKDEYAACQKMFDDYVRGGVEELYESLIVRKPDPEEAYGDEKTANLMAFLERVKK